MMLRRRVPDLTLPYYRLNRVRVSPLHHDNVPTTVLGWPYLG